MTALAGLATQLPGHIAIALALHAGAFAIVGGGSLLMSDKNSSDADPMKSESLSMMQKRIELAVSAAQLGMWDVHLDRKQCWCSENWMASLGYDISEPDMVTADHYSFDSYIHSDDLPSYKFERERLEAGSISELTMIIRMKAKSGDWRFVKTKGSAVEFYPSGKPKRISGVYVDVTEQQVQEFRQKENTEALWRLANIDGLTDLPNRRLFGEKLSALIERCRAKALPLAVALINLDHFKEINESLGHESGDEYLKLVAERLREVARFCDIPARIGGDEFAVIMLGVSNPDVLKKRVKKFSDALSQSIRLSNGARRSGATTGYAVFPEDGTDANILLYHADMALDECRKSERGAFRQFDRVMEAKIRSQINLRRDFEIALERNEIVPFFQPIMTAERGSISGFEALARWNHPVRGILTPAAFASMLEDATMAPKLDAAMRTCIFSLMQSWKQQGLAFGRMSVNLTSGDLLSRNFTAGLLEELVLRDLSSDDITLEVTEGVLLDGTVHKMIRNTLSQLSEAGFLIAFDDFGTGYASLSHLRDFPIDRVKIDRSFVMGLPHSKRDIEIIRALLTLASSFGLEVIAEGVETPEQAEALTRMGKISLQGYLFGKPMHPDRVPYFVRRFDEEMQRIRLQSKVA
jgi:diguanylate cyclase (GGDEF)-like protein